MAMLFAESKGLGKRLTVRGKLTGGEPMVDLDNTHFFEFFEFRRVVSAD
jgi:hypothetical protein